MPAPATSQDPLPIGDTHSIKFFGKNAADAARDFFNLPLSLPVGEYIVEKKGGEVHLYGTKAGILRPKFTGVAPDTEFEPGATKFTIAGHPVVVIHQQALGDQPGSFNLVKKLLPVVEQVAEFQRLKGLSYKAGEEEKRASDLEKMKELLNQIQTAYSAKPTPPAATKKAAKAKDLDEEEEEPPAPPPRRSPPPSRPTRPAPSSYTPPTSTYSRSSG